MCQLFAQLTKGMKPEEGKGNCSDRLGCTEEEEEEEEEGEEKEEEEEEEEEERCGKRRMNG